MYVLIGAGRKGKIGNTEFHYNDTTDYYLYRNEYGTDGQLKEIKKFNSELIQNQRIVCSKTATGERLVYYNRNNIEKEIIVTGTNKTTKLYSDLNDYKKPTHTIIEALNKKGSPIKETIEAVGGLVNSETLYTYDEHNNVINEKSRIRNAWGQGEDVLITIRYDYDNKGNWVRKIVFKNGKVKSWIERVIYYASSPSDYTRIVEQDKQVTERHKRLKIKEKQYEDSVAVRQRQIEDSIAVRKKQIEDSIEAVTAKLDAIIENELLQNHVTVSVNKKGKVTTTNTVKTGNVSTRLKNGKVTGISFNFGSSSSKKKKTK